MRDTSGPEDDLGALEWGPGLPGVHADCSQEPRRLSTPSRAGFNQLRWAHWGGHVSRSRQRDYGAIVNEVQRLGRELLLTYGELLLRPLSGAKTKDIR
jgi:hypothetical protein